MGSEIASSIRLSARSLAAICKDRVTCLIALYNDLAGPGLANPNRRVAARGLSCDVNILINSSLGKSERPVFVTEDLPCLARVRLCRGFINSCRPTPVAMQCARQPPACRILYRSSSRQHPGRRSDENDLNGREAVSSRHCDQPNRSTKRLARRERI